MQVVDLSGPIRNGMWHYPEPYPAPEIVEIPAPEWLEYPIYSQRISMAVQTSTYLETAAHLDRNRITIDRVDLATLVDVPTTVVRTPVPARSEITTDDLRQALPDDVSPDSLAGSALLVATGWDREWDEPHFLVDGPFFSTDAIEWIVEEVRPRIFGADLPRFDSPDRPRNHLVRFFQSDTLMLAPLRNLGSVPEEPGTLIVLPLAIEEACASPVRAVWVSERRT